MNNIWGDNIQVYAYCINIQFMHYFCANRSTQKGDNSFKIWNIWISFAGIFQNMANYNRCERIFKRIIFNPFFRYNQLNYFWAVM